MSIAEPVPHGAALLAAQHSGTTAFTLKWAHDVTRSEEPGEGMVGSQGAVLGAVSEGKAGDP